MTNFRFLVARRTGPAMLAVVVLIGLASGVHAETSDGKPSAKAVSTRAEQGMPLPIELSDARTYRHCHNTPRRTYCHTKEHLPIRPRVSSASLSLSLSHAS